MAGTLAAAFFAQPANAADEDIEVPKPDTISVDTKDGVHVRCSWFPGGVLVSPDGKKTRVDGKKVVPIILVHGWGGRRAEYSAIASYLQRLGHAVVVPDLRGHGDSKQVDGMDGDLKYEDMSNLQIATMWRDLQAVKKFLMEKNNAAELNIELLTVVAAEEMSIIALDWAIRDWSQPQFLGKKNGKDVKAVVFLSPSLSFRRLSFTKLLSHPLMMGRGFTLSTMFIVGDNDFDALRDTKSAHTRLKNSRPKIDDDLKKEELLKKQNLFLVTRETELQGTKLLDPALKMNLETQIAGFIYYQLTAKADEYAWTNRDPDKE